MNSKAKMAQICAVVICIAGAFWIAVTRQSNLTTLTYSQFLEKVQTGQLGSVMILGSNSGSVEAICTLKDGKAVPTVLPADYRDAMLAMREQQVGIEIRDASARPLPRVVKSAPFLIVLSIWIFLMLGKPLNGFRLSFRR